MVILRQYDNLINSYLNLKKGLLTPPLGTKSVFKIGLIRNFNLAFECELPSIHFQKKI